MSSPDLKSTVLFVIAAVLIVCIVYQYDRTLFGLLGRSYDGFADAPSMNSSMPPKPEEKKTSPFRDMNPPADNTAAVAADAGAANVMGVKDKMSNGGTKEGFADLASAEGPAAFASAEAPAGCYPRDQLTPTELLPADQNTIYAQQNPMGIGSLKGKNFLSAGALIGVNTVGQSLRNANLQLRSEPPNPQVPVSIFLQSTIGPDISHRPLEVGS
jgi:hypothetical protein